MTTEANKEAPAPQPGTPEHDAAMAAVADKAMGTTTPPAPEPAKRPDHVPEKFWDATKGEVRLEDLAKSYAELERKQSQAAPAKPAVETPPATEKPASEVTPATPANAAEAVKKAGLDMAALNAEFAEKGDLTPETRTKLEQAGYAKDMVDGYIAGQKALAEQYQAKAESAAGGKTQLDAMLKWGGQNMTPAEAKAFNDAVVSGDDGRMGLAIKGLRASYEAAEGTTPTLVNGNTGSSVTEGYASQAEMVKAMGDKRYKTDAAYRATVESKVGLSKFF